MSRPTRRLMAWVLAAGLAAAPAAAHENTVTHRGMGHWSVDILGNPFYTSTYRTEIGNGCEQEDVPATRSLGHFYNPQTNSAPWFALGSGPATDNSQDQYDEAVAAYLSNNFVGTDAAFHRMGRALHFVQDMTSPAHTHDDDHATGDDFEGWGPDNFPSMDFSTVTPKYASPPTADEFVREIGRLVYDNTVYQAVLHEDDGAQPSSLIKTMFPSLHFEEGGFFTDDHFEIDRIGDWGCDLLCVNDWWIPDELLTTDTGPGGVVRHTGSVYIENTGGDGGPVVPTVFRGQPNTASESMLQLYARHFYPEAIAYGAGLLQTFATQMGAPLPTATGTATVTATRTNTPLATATSTGTGTVTATGTHTATATATHTATITPTPLPTNTPTNTPLATRTATASSTATGTNTATFTRTPSGTPTLTIPPSATPTPSPTMTPLCGATPRTDCAAASTGKSKLQLKNTAPDTGDKLTWRWSNGTVLPGQFGSPATTTDYALCIYDRVGGVPTLAQVASAPAGGTCGSRTCWKTLGTGFKYSNPVASADGVRTVVLQYQPGGTGKLLVKGKGLNLAMPAPVGGQMFAQDQAVVAQLVNDAGSCWTATYSIPSSRNLPSLFKDSSD